MPNKGYYSSFQLPADLVHAEDLIALLRQLWNYRYPDLYEEESDGRQPIDLDDALLCLITFVTAYEHKEAHHRLLYLGMALALAVVPTVRGWSPQDHRPEFVLNAVRAYLRSGQPIAQDWETLLNPLGSGSQALDEAIDALKNLAQALTPTEAPHALRNMLDDCLVGYAVFPGSEGRRDFYNWVLVEAVPAAWSLRLPSSVYTLAWPWPPNNSHLA